MSKITIKFAAVGVAIMTVASLSGPVFAQTVDVSAQIAALLAQISALQAQLGAPASTSSFNFAKNLTLGSKGADVKALQGVLISGGFLKIAAPTNFFGPLTKAAVIAWQKSVGISPASGFVGPLSRAKLNAAVVTTPPSGPVGTPVPAGTDLVVTKAVNSPSDRTIGSGTAFNPALVLNLTAGSKAVKVTSLTVFKSGFLGNTNLNGVDVVDSMRVRHGNVISSVGADNTIVIGFPTAPITIAAGMTETVTIRFNLVSGAMTGTVVMSLQSVAAISADTSAISGAFPISGGIMNVVNGSTSLAGVSLDALTSTGSSSLSVDPANWQEITKFRVKETTSNEGTKIYSWMLYNYGNAGSGDYSDVQLLDQTGTVLATAQPMGQYITFNLSANPYLIDKGMTKDFTVRAKLINGTTKTIQLVTYDNYDLDIRGIATGVSILPTFGSNDLAFPIGNGFNIQTIGSGTMTLSRSVDTPSAAVTPGTNDTVLAKYNAKPTGENMELRQVSFGISGLTTALTGTVYVRVNDATVYSVAASTLATSGAVSTITLSTYPILTAGVNNTIVVTGSVNSSAVSTDVYTVKSFDLIQAKRLVTNDLVDPGTSAIDGLAIAIQAGKITITNLSTPSTQSVVRGTVGFEFAQVQLSAQGGGEDIKVSKVVLTDTSAGATDLTNAVIYKDSDTSPLVTSASTASFSAALNGTVTFNFQTPVLVTRATPVVFHVKADVTTGASTSTTHSFNIAASTATAYGSVTGNSLSGTSLIAAGTSNTMSVASSGTLTLSLVSGSGATPSSDQVVTAGTTGATYLAFKLTSQVETQKITSLKVTASGTALSTTTLKNIALYQDAASTPFTTAGQWDSCASNTCTVTFTATDNLLSAAVPTTGTTIYVKGDVPAGGSGVTLADSFKLSIAANTDIVVKGAVSAATTTATGTAVPTAISYVAPQSVVVSAVSPTGATQVGLSSGQVVGIFQVTNNGTAPIYLATTTKFTVTNGGSATTSVTFGLYASAQGGTQSDTSVTLATSSTSGGATGASSSIPFDLSASGSSEPNRTINGGSSRFLTIKTSGVAANNDTFALSISALGNATYFVKESDLGYSGNPFTNSTILDTLPGMYMSGVPSLGTVTAKT